MACYNRYLRHSEAFGLLIRGYVSLGLKTLLIVKHRNRSFILENTEITALFYVLIGMILVIRGYDKLLYLGENIELNKEHLKGREQKYTDNDNCGKSVSHTYAKQNVSQEIYKEQYTADNKVMLYT